MRYGESPSESKSYQDALIHKQNISKTKDKKNSCVLACFLCGALAYLLNNGADFEKIWHFIHY